MATKKEILDYCTYTPHNTNRHVLSTMLDEFVTSDNKQEIELSATANNIYTPASGKVYNKVTVNVPQPTGKITINDNGTNIDIAQYATADVAVSGGEAIETYGVELYNSTLEDDLHIIIPECWHDQGAFIISTQELINGDASMSYGLVEGRNYITIVGEIPNGYELYLEDSEGDSSDILQFDPLAPNYTGEQGRYYLNITEDTFGLSFKLRQSS